MAYPVVSYNIGSKYIAEVQAYTPAYPDPLIPDGLCVIEQSVDSSVGISPDRCVTTLAVSRWIELVQGAATTDVLDGVCEVVMLEFHIMPDSAGAGEELDSGFYAAIDACVDLSRKKIKIVWKSTGAKQPTSGDTGGGSRRRTDG